MNSPGFDLSLADFYMGHDTDPLKTPDGFTDWRQATLKYQSLYERRLLQATSAHTEIETLGGAKKIINMASLDYLGLCSHPELIRVHQQALEQWGNGAGGVPLLSGMCKTHESLEQRVSQLTGQESTQLYSSGFAAAIGFAVALLRKSDIAICDQRAHISWVDGIKMSGASLVTFQHNDIQDLDRLLGKYKDRRRVVIVDGLYSMDGDYANLPEILSVTEKYGVSVVVDEAHSIFAAGENGGGAVEHFGVQDRVSMVMGTFSKALGFVGGFLSGSKGIIDYLRFYSHPYVFSSAIPPAMAATIHAAIDFSANNKLLREKLWDNADYFRSELKKLGFNIGTSETWVVPIILGNNRELLYESVLHLEQRGLYVAPVDYPAVSEDQIRIRTAVSAAHNKEDLDLALGLLEETLVRPPR